MSAEGKKAFGGAKVIYVATQVQKAEVKKESGQTDRTFTADEVERPYSETRGDLIAFYTGLPDLNAFHSRCLGAKVACTVGLGLSIKKGKAKDDKEALSSVNDFGQSFTEVICRVGLDFEACGSGYLEVVRNLKGEVSELYHMPATDIVCRKLKADSAFYYINSAGAKVPYPRFASDQRDERSLVQFTQYTNRNRYYGLPDWTGCIPDIELDYFAARYNQNFFINSGIPNLAIVIQGGQFDEETEQEVQKFFQANFKGLENAHRTLYLPIRDKDVEVKFEKLAVDTKNQDASFQALRNQCRDNIVSAHGVPPRLVGVLAGGQLGGGGEVGGQLKLFKEIVIDPKQALFEAKLRPVLKDFGVEDFQFVDMDVNIQEQNSTYYPAMTSAGIISVDEARDDLGLGPAPEDLKARNDLKTQPPQLAPQLPAQGQPEGAPAPGSPAAKAAGSLALVRGLSDFRKSLG